MGIKDIAIFGAGGFGREVACLINSINGKEPLWRFVGFFDDNETLWGSENHYGRIIGGIGALNEWVTPLHLVIAIGSPDILRSVAERISNPNVFFPNLIDPSVVFLDPDTLSIGKGNIITANSFVSCQVEIGDFNILNGYVCVGHDVKIGNHNVLMPSCHVSGGVVIGNSNFLGLQSSVLQNVTIGNNTRIGAGSVVIRKTKDGYLYLGNPARRFDI